MVLLKKMFWTILLVYIGLGAYIFFTHKSSIYFPNFPTKSDFYACTNFTQDEQLNINGTRAYHSNVSNKIVVIYHGNAGSACDRAYFKPVIENAGYSYLFVEYAGYAGDENKPSRPLLLKDAENVTSFLKEKNYSEVTLLTESIGSGVASYHASLLPPQKMIFITPFDSLVNVAKSHFPFYLYPITLMAKFSDENYANSPLLQNYSGELIVIYGENDSIIPIKNSRSLFDNAPTSNKKFVEISGANHNDIYSFKDLWDTLAESLN